MQGSEVIIHTQSGHTDESMLNLPGTVRDDASADNAL